jgi:hypothetical protein
MARPPKYETPEEMQRIIDLYFLACKVSQTGNTKLLEDLPEEDLLIINDIEDTYPTVCGLALVLNLTRQGLIDYGVREEFIDTVKRAKQSIESFLEQRLYGNAPTGTIFNLKNNFGWKDQKELDLSGGLNITNADDLTDDQLAAIATGGSKEAAGKKGGKKKPS